MRERGGGFRKEVGEKSGKYRVVDWVGTRMASV